MGTSRNDSLGAGQRYEHGAKRQDENSPTVPWPMLGVTKQLDLFERRFRGTRRQSPATRHVSTGNDPGIGGTLAVFWHF